MRRTATIAALSALLSWTASCGTERPASTVTAKNRITGETRTFSSSEDVPESWVICEGDDCSQIASGDSRAGVPQCEFPCPTGMDNPVDDSGCVHSCECEPLGGPSEPAPTAPCPACELQCPPGTTNPV